VIAVQLTSGFDRHNQSEQFAAGGVCQIGTGLGAVGQVDARPAAWTSIGPTTRLWARP
jgi:hypothetical protein